MMLFPIGGDFLPSSGSNANYFPDWIKGMEVSILKKPKRDNEGLMNKASLSDDS